MKQPFSNYDVSENFGDKPLNGVGQERIRTFAQWIFTRPERVVIVGGHSLWFRDFFRNFLPHTSDHDSKNAKIKNCGVISFTLARGTHDGKLQYRIDPSSIQVIYGGFEKPSKQKWKPPQKKKK